MVEKITKLSNKQLKFRDLTTKHKRWQCSAKNSWTHMQMVVNDAAFEFCPMIRWFCLNKLSGVLWLDDSLDYQFILSAKFSFSTSSLQWWCASRNRKPKLQCHGVPPVISLNINCHMSWALFSLVIIWKYSGQMSCSLQI